MNAKKNQKQNKTLIERREKRQMQTSTRFYHLHLRRWRGSVFVDVYEFIFIYDAHTKQPF